MNRRIHNAALAALVGACLALFGSELAAAAAVRPPQEASACTPHVASGGCLAVAEPSTTDGLPHDATRAGDLPAAAARRRSRVPTSSPPLTVAEPDGDGPTSDGAVPVSGRPVGAVPTPQPLPPAMTEPAPELEPEVGPTAPPEPSPPRTGRAQPPARPPSGRLPATGGATAAAAAGAFLSLGGLCIGAGRHARTGR
jgi:hypothetical protein